MVGHGLADHTAKDAMKVERRKVRYPRDLIERERPIEIRVDIRQNAEHPLLVRCRGFRFHHWNRIRSGIGVLDLFC
jgi:hypothetical protein